MSLSLAQNNARMTVIGVGWDKTDDPDYTLSDEATILQEITESLGYDFGEDMDWESLTDLIDIDLTDALLIDDANLIETQDGLIYADEWLNTDGLLDGEWTNLETHETITGYPEGLVGTTGTTYLPQSTYETIANQIARAALDPDTLADNDASEISTGMPVRITVLVKPDTLEYDDGDTIDFTGIMVAAWKSKSAMLPYRVSGWSGSLNNIIPNSQLTFPVTVADKDDNRYYTDTEVYAEGDINDLDVVVNGVGYEYNPDHTIEQDTTQFDIWLVDGVEYTSTQCIEKGFFIPLTTAGGMNIVDSLYTSDETYYRA